jgi:hypothetical protein
MSFFILERRKKNVKLSDFLGEKLNMDSYFLNLDFLSCIGANAEVGRGGVRKSLSYVSILLFRENGLLTIIEFFYEYNLQTLKNFEIELINRGNQVNL